VKSIEEISLMNAQIATAAEEQSATAVEINGNVERAVGMSLEQNSKTQKAGEIAVNLRNNAGAVAKKLEFFSV
jgi:methyl-accepting chemotaxis protein